MRKLCLYFSICTFVASCSGNNNNPNCNFLLDVGVNISINLNLPQYSQLNFISNSVYVPDAGNKGIIVTNTGTGFVAWDAADPNRVPNDCSTLSIQGVEGVSGCSDANTYSLYTGQPLNNPDLLCGLKAYRIEQNGNTLVIFN
jgi:nitrite reductase/ring-hydroxylating ferredoxin subunit